MRFHARYVWIAAGALASGCLTDEGSLVPPAAFTKIDATDNQVGLAGGRLAAPFEVLVQAEDGSGVVRIGVTWTAVGSADPGSLSDTFTVTDGRGRAQVWLTLGAAAGTYTVQATMTGDPTRAVTFTATALPAPALTSVNPATFSAGDAVTVTGTNFTAATTFAIGGVEAALTGAPSSNTATVVAPHCLPPGVVAVEARLQGVRSSPVTATYTASTSPIVLAVGEFLSIGAAEVQGCALLPAAGPAGAEYALAPQAVTGDPNVAVAYRLRSGPGALTAERLVASPRPPTFAERFHAEIRRMERDYSSARSAAPAPPGPAAAETAPVLVGQVREFSVCSRFPCRTTGDFESVRAAARFVGHHAAIFQDVDAPGGGFSDADFGPLGSVFDEVLYDIGTAAFGAESDIDANGLVLILLTPAVNKLTDPDECANSFVTGFFLPIDVDPSFQRDPRSNQGEVFYAFVPDPDGEVTCQHSVTRVRNGVPVTFVHEFQHMISYYQHVILRDGRAEVLWLNEGLSHLAEELAGQAFRAAGDNDSFSRYVIGDLLNAFRYLKNPGGTFLVTTEGGGTLEERGAAWLFLRWLLDAYGDDITRRLVETNLTSSQNVEAATGRTMPELLAAWFLANWVSDLLADSQVPALLTYQTWAFRTTFSSLHDQVPQTFDVPFPIVPPLLTVPFDRPGTLRSGSGEYYRIVQGAGGPAIPLEFVGSGGAPLGSEADPRLNLFRVR